LSLLKKNGADHLKTIAANHGGYLSRGLTSFAPNELSSSIVHQNFAFCHAEKAFAPVSSSHRFAHTGIKTTATSKRKAANFLKRAMSRL
jgi:hypothetical protein